MLPIIPLRDVVVFPYMVLPLFIGRGRSIEAFEAAANHPTSKLVMLLTQKTSNVDQPELEDLYTVGTIANVLQLMKLPDGTAKVLVEGLQRGCILTKKNNLKENKQLPKNSKTAYIQAPVLPLETDPILDQPEREALVKTLLNSFENYVKLSRKLPLELLGSFYSIEDPVRLVDLITAHTSLKIVDKQALLSLGSLRHRIEKLLVLLESELEILEIEHQVEASLKKNVEKSHREYYLHEKIKAYQKELGVLNNTDEFSNEVEQLKKKLEEAKLPKEAHEKARSEIQKLKMMPPMAAEATVIRNYVDAILSLPWHKTEGQEISLSDAESILNQEHHGLEKVKERVVEFLAVQKRVQKISGPILCLVGPPGVGKTSLGQSIAKAVGRKYARIALGGVRDEAEIRGHRRTYIGALMGKIMQTMAKVGVKNPLILLDEIDKMSVDFRGDPASALLEVLDPEQNKAFNDHYLELDYDLSDVMFVTTANTLNMPLPLLDRMEVIRLSGYTEDEKLEIAKAHLIPKQKKINGLADEELILPPASVLEIIRYYTREAGVRNLERELAKICRKVVRKLLTSKTRSKSTSIGLSIGVKDLENYLGVQKFHYGQAESEDLVGQVTGLAWTEVGGDILSIEVKTVPGKAKITCTGKLGDVMQESIQAALTVVRAHYQFLDLAPDFYEKYDIHVHLPEGATPKDGPSAGIAVCTALTSAFTGRKVSSDLAMTGEITLGGQVLAIGGLKEKLLAARRAGIKRVLIPKDNLKDLKEIPDLVYKGLKIIPVSKIKEVWKHALIQVEKKKARK
ncbi:MAG: endopeptidase La [Gammaproteobacteria bacterium]